VGNALDLRLDARGGLLAPDRGELSLAALAVVVLQDAALFEADVRFRVGARPAFGRHDHLPGKETADFGY
jgi:hypothetical protein